MQARLWLLPALLLVALVLASPCLTERATGADKKSDEPNVDLVARWYNIGALLDEPVDHQFAFLGYMRNARWSDRYYGYAGGIFDDDDDDDEEEVTPAEFIEEYLTAAVRSQEPWESCGGRGTIEVFTEKGLMLVRQTLDGHEKVRQALADLEDTLVPTLTCRIRVVELDEKFLAGASPDGVLAAETPEKQKLLEEAFRETHAETVLTGLCGQGLSSNSGLAQTILDDIEPVVAENATAFDPTINFYLNGLAAYVRPKMLSDAARVRLDYRLCCSRVLSRRQVPIESAADRVNAKTPIELADFVCDQRAGVATVSLGVPTVVASGTVPAKIFNPTAPEAETVHVCYLVTVSRNGAAAPQAKP